MSYVESRWWADYLRRHGGLNVAQRVEQAAALICATGAQLMGNKTIKVADFIPKRDGDDELKTATPQDFLKVLKWSKSTLDASKPK